MAGAKVEHLFHQFFVIPHLDRTKVLFGQLRVFLVLLLDFYDEIAEKVSF